MFDDFAQCETADNRWSFRHNGYVESSFLDSHCLVRSSYSNQNHSNGLHSENKAILAWNRPISRSFVCSRRSKFVPDISFRIHSARMKRAILIACSFFLFYTYMYHMYYTVFIAAFSLDVIRYTIWDIYRFSEGAFSLELLSFERSMVKL